MRAPFQILAIPYRMVEGRPLYCVLHRSDADQWQFIAGGGEDDETPEQAAIREIREEGGVNAEDILRLSSVCSIPVENFPKREEYHWPEDTYVVPEYSFGFHCKGDIRLSREHTDYLWLTYEEARRKLQWDSNRTALYELDRRLKKAQTAQTAAE